MRFRKYCGCSELWTKKHNVFKGFSSISQAVSKISENGFQLWNSYESRQNIMQNPLKHYVLHLKMQKNAILHLKIQKNSSYHLKIQKNAILHLKIQKNENIQKVKINTPEVS